MFNASTTVQVVFMGSTVLAAGLFLRAVSVGRARASLILGLWVALQGVVAATGIYADVGASPPRFPLAVGPPLLAIGALVGTRRGRTWLRSLDIRALVWLHIVRIPVEIGLHQLYTEGLVPEVMTWEGRNFDILSGLSAPIVAWLAFRSPAPRYRLLLGWNALALALVLIIVVHGVLSLPFEFQQFGFEQPNIALLYFPFNWLPALIVPVVILSHIAVFIKLLGRGGNGEALTGAPPARRAS